MVDPIALEMIDSLRTEYLYCMTQLKRIVNSPLSSEIDRQLAQQSLLKYTDLGKKIDELTWFYREKEES